MDRQLRGSRRDVRPDTGAYLAAVRRPMEDDRQVSPRKFPTTSAQPEEESPMLRLPVRFALAAGLLVALATTAAAQTGGVARPPPSDPNCNPLKCYQAADPATIVRSNPPPL